MYAPLLSVCLPLLVASVPFAPAYGATRSSRPAQVAKVEPVRALSVAPSSVALAGPEATRQLLVTARFSNGERDLTHAARYRSTNPRVATVTPEGVVRLVGDGAAHVEVAAGGKSLRVPITTRDAGKKRPLAFTRDVLPVLAKAGCNGSACHAKQGGKGGFQLSVLAYDPEADYEAVAYGSGGRRLNRADPGRSLLLLKPTMGLPHAGGQRFAVDSPECRLLARWIAEGARPDAPTDATVARVVVEPAERTLLTDQPQQLAVTAIYTDGSRRDVTALADYKSNEESVAGVSEGGLLRTTRYPGETAVMVRYMGQVAVARITVPLNQGIPASAYAKLPRNNWIDDLVYRKLARLNLLPSAAAEDGAFLRRASLDLIGTLPTAAETRAFLEDGTPDKRAKLIERLLDRPEYADYWAMRWVNLLLVDRDPLFPKGAFAYDRWVRDAFRDNMPYDQFATALVTAQGETYRDGPANFYRALATPQEQAKSLSQLFLGVRIDCAQCHHHPFERWSQNDFYSMAAIFARVRRKGLAEFEQTVYVTNDGEVKHPKTDQVMPPQPLGAQPLSTPNGTDRRAVFAHWLTSPENPFFARAIVNRAWGQLMGRGLVEPVDDFRVTNPASNEALLDALAKDFIAHKYDVKHLLRTIATSAAYGRSSETTRNNAKDTQNYARYYPKRPVGEVLLDAISQVTGVAEQYQGHPPGTRAIQMWDNKLEVEFLDVFGRPSRLSVCECDRPSDGSMTQVLHLMNAANVQNRLTADNGAAATLAGSGKSNSQVVTELFLTAYSRFPKPLEMAAAQRAFTRAGTTRRQAIEDLLWALLNSPEFQLLR